MAGREEGWEGKVPSTVAFKCKVGGAREVTAASRKCHMSLTAEGCLWTPGGHSHPRELKKDVCPGTLGRCVGADTWWVHAFKTGALTSSPSFLSSTPAKPAVTRHLCEPAGYKLTAENVLTAHNLTR